MLLLISYISHGFLVIRYFCKKHIINSVVLLCYSTFISNAQASHSDNLLDLQQSIQVAIEQDIWHQKNRKSSEIEQAESVISSAMPNPTLNIEIANLASDTFRFDQERMTQFKLKLSQQFLRGDTANLSQKMKRERREMYPILAQERQEKVKLAVATLWLNAFADNYRKTIVEQAKLLLEQLISTAQRRYEVGSQNVSQSEIIIAQVELTALEDRISQLEQSASISQQKLRQWLPSQLVDFNISTEYSPIKLALTKLPVNDQQWSDTLYNHPTLFVFIKMHQALTTGIDIAKQSKKTQWGVNASYGFRSDDPMGNSRSDLLSVGVSLDIPLFNQASNNSKVLIAKKQLSMHQTDRLLQLQSMIATARAEQANLHQLDKRLALYRDKLLPQTQNIVDAASSSYHNDKGDFSSIMHAKLSQLNREIESFDISIKKQMSILTLNYLLTQTDHHFKAPISNKFSISEYQNNNGGAHHE